MKMINVLQRLAELDSQNPNVASAKPQVTADAAVEAIQKSLSEELSAESLSYLAGVKKTIAECGMMPGMPPAGTPASFSINATAASGDEVANMLNNIMALAGVKDAGPSVSTPAAKPTASQPEGPGVGGDMKQMLDTMNKADDGLSADADGAPEDEGVLGTMGGAGLGALVGGPLGAMAGGVAGNAVGDMMSGDEEASEDDSAPDAGGVDIAGVGGALAGAAIHGDAEGAAKGMQDGEDESLTGANEDMRRLIDAVSGPEYDSTPADPTDVPEYDSDKLAYDPNQGDHRERQTGLARANPMEDVTAKLFADYEQFIAEGKDEGKPGKGFKKMVDKLSPKYGKKRAQKIAGAQHEKMKKAGQL